MKTSIQERIWQASHIHGAHAVIKRGLADSIPYLLTILACAGPFGSHLTRPGSQIKGGKAAKRRER